jgi:hypothetical protein
MVTYEVEQTIDLTGRIANGETIQLVSTVNP